MTTNDLKAWLLLAGFKCEFSRYFYLRSGFDHLVTVAVLVDEAVEVYSFTETRTYMNYSDAQQYIQELIGNQQ